MHRRQFITGTGVLLASSGLTLAGCTTTPLGSGETAEDYTQKRNTINAGIDSTLARLQSTVNGSQEIIGKARGVLVFPSVFAAGFWFGGQYGQGGLRVDGQTTGYYSTVAGSFGLQIGAQSKAIIFAFLTQEALDRFTQSQGWAAGADATVALAKIGANGNLDTSTAMSPVVAFVLTNAGLMAGISLEGTKVSRLVI
ncbi:MULTISPECIES: BPSL1445 family SYLF domain-containing lipoprotein [Paraburkholderia]|jgi:lipid-binding SYLF domain-containing protein|uniref:Lipid-binding SYLF domain-containing protein n=1 Tax=Paraburkholderia phenazinium TaxID=60549 RepID=A0A1N6GWS2_9BURK|nr:YSC84-related protein [Paraburkholderia phenazinium]SIO11989.1 Lipid-binding SYLF domain-containing protein [Paraburkholderia phenazinium]